MIKFDNIFTIQRVAFDCVNPVERCAFFLFSKNFMEVEFDGYKIKYFFRNRTSRKVNA